MFMAYMYIHIMYTKNIFNTCHYCKMEVLYVKTLIILIFPGNHKDYNI